MESLKQLLRCSICPFCNFTFYLFSFSHFWVTVWTLNPRNKFLASRRSTETILPPQKLSKFEKSNPVCAKSQLSIFKILTDDSTAGLPLPISYTLGLRHKFCCRDPISNPRPVLSFSTKTTRGMVLGFLCKTSKHACLSRHSVLVFSRVFLVTVSRFELKINFLLSQTIIHVLLT